MFDIAPSELIVLGVVALVVIPPKDLPKAMRLAGQWVGRARGVARQFRAGFDEMIREAELSDLKQQWAEENARIMREHPLASLDYHAPPAADLPVEDAPPMMTAQPAFVDTTPQAIAMDATPPAGPAPEDTPTPKPKRKPRAKSVPPA